MNVSSSGASSENPKSVSSSLLEALRNQEPAAWERLVRLYGSVVLNWSQRAGLQPADAEDVVQDVFRTVTAKIDTFQRERPSDTFRGWLWTITWNKIGNFFTQQRGQPQAAGGTDAQRRMSRRAEPAAAFDSTESYDPGGLFDKALESIQCEFEQSSWQAFWRVVIGGQSPGDVATDLGLSVNAVYLAKSRILRRVREELGDDVQ